MPDRSNIELLRQTAEGAPIIYRLGQFAPSSHELLPEHQGFLDGFIRRVLSNGRSRVTLIGHMVLHGPYRETPALARRRVNSTRDFLLSALVDPSRISVGPIVTGEDSCRAVDLHLDFQLDHSFVIGLHNVDIVRPRDVVIERMEGAFASLASNAGRSLSVISSIPHRNHEFTSRPDIILTFSREFRFTHHHALGIEGDGVLVDAWEDQRVIRTPIATRTPTGLGGALFNIDYNSCAEPMFTNGEPDFARAVANTAIHELGHVFGLDHVCDDPENPMFTVASAACGRYGLRYLPNSLEARSQIRQFWAGDKHFDDVQEREISLAIRVGRYFQRGSTANSSTTSGRQPRAQD